MIVFVNETERRRVEDLKREHVYNFQQAEQLREFQAKQMGVPFVPTEYVPVSDEDALAAVRAGWKSFLDKQFEAKARREGWG